MSTEPAGRRWPLSALRVLAMILLVQVFLQAVLAGGFIGGDVTLLNLHSANGILLALTSMALIVAAVLVWRPGRGPRWPIAFSVAFWVLVVLQIGVGFTRQVGLHIPLGMTIFGMISAFTWWAFSRRRMLVPA